MNRRNLRNLWSGNSRTLYEFFSPQFALFPDSTLTARGENYSEHVGGDPRILSRGKSRTDRSLLFALNVPGQRGATVPQMYRVRYSMKPSGQHHRGTDVVTAEVEGDLEDIPDRIPAGAYIMYVEDLTVGRNVHWTRWPKSYRPGFGL